MKPLMLALTGMLLMTGAVGRTQGQTSPPDTGTMMAGREHMMMSMQSSDTRLDDLLTQLNGAKGNDRIDKLVAVVNELVAERKRMQGMMRMMHGGGAPTDDHSTHHPEAAK